MPRKPTAQHIAEGTDRPHRHESRRREPKPEGKPVKPKGMSKDAQQLWDHLVPGLADKGIATDWDTCALQAMCEAWAEYRAALRVRATGLDEKSRRQRMVNSARRAWIELASKFGLTPSDRARLEVEEGADETNPLEQMVHYQPTLRVTP